MRTLFIAGMILAFSSAASAQDIDAYLCVPSKTTGFEYNLSTKTWDVVTFNNEDKWLIKRPANENLESDSLSSPPSWIVKRLGEEVILMYCADDFSSYGELNCKGFGVFNLTFNRTKLQYLYTHTSFWWEHTPYMEIGTCTKL